MGLDGFEIILIDDFLGGFEGVFAALGAAEVIPGLALHVELFAFVKGPELESQETKGQDEQDIGAVLFDEGPEAILEPTGEIVFLKFVTFLSLHGARLLGVNRARGPGIESHIVYGRTVDCAKFSGDEAWKLDGCPRVEVEKWYATGGETWVFEAIVKAGGGTGRVAFG